MCFVQVVYNLMDRWACILSLLSSYTNVISGNISHGFLSLIFPVLRLLHSLLAIWNRKRESEREREKHEREGSDIV